MTPAGGQKGKARARTPSGPRLPPAQLAARNTLMVTRRAQGWSWEAVAGEAGISVPAARSAVTKHVETMPLNLGMDPVRIVQETFTQFQLSVGDFEAMAAAALESGQVAVAVGAKRSANDAREKIILLLQRTGRLPQELGELRHLIDLRAIAVRMLDAMDSFDREMALIARLEGEDERRDAAVEASRKVRGVFNELIGGAEDQPVLEGTASE